MDKKNPSLSESFAAKLLLHITVRQSREVNNLEPRCNINSVAQLALTYSLFSESAVDIHWCYAIDVDCKTVQYIQRSPV